MSELQNLPITQLQPNPWNRTVFDPQAMTDLVASVKAVGIKEPLIVRPLIKSPSPISGEGGGEGLQYQIASGHRRWLAAKEAGLKEVPCLVQSLSDEQVAEDNIVINIQRESLPALELSRMLEEYRKRYDKTQQQLATVFGKTQGWISQYLGFLELHPDLKIITAVIFSMADLRALKQLPPTLQQEIAQEIQNGTLKPENIQKRCNQLRFTSRKPSVGPRSQEVDPLADVWNKVGGQLKEGWQVTYSGKVWHFRIENPEIQPNWFLKDLFLKLADAMGDTEKEQAHLIEANQLGRDVLAGKYGDMTAPMKELQKTMTPEQAADYQMSIDAFKKISELSTKPAKGSLDPKIAAMIARRKAQRMLP